MVVNNNHKFYMASYLVYLLATRAMDNPRLFKKGSMQDANTWPYIVYAQFVKKNIPKNNKEYRIVNDAFIFTIIQYIEGDYVKRMSEEATTKISKIGAYYIQYRTFTYLRVVDMMRGLYER